ncbi:nucleotidyl transferase AbiEii/AbiGii toxin family protein [Luteimonas sp. 8-5]|uniref:nucleotidyl transferase AbiEii/AbiGii toxin family protein n=1 Tax=Luteimonas sp. 8-5 TaxID=3039387 RepID=UPI0024364FAF|nr:nucleotidyl transferase AbiEii/AbiGii toxin family protein [Luteimonas sp. 8-5]MDG6347620.1 nucleotidyl transferase AbiEii/AbiGii toxin family protein [Luteimonas sp. 8-5]
MIPQRSISKIANTLTTAGGRRIPESVIERDYVLAWFLTGLAVHPLREVMVFKGGTALRRCWFEDYRFSEDLDFTLSQPITLQEILAGLAEIFASIESASGLRIAFDREDRHGHQNSHTFYLRYQGPLPASNDVKVDVTINEVLCFPLQERPVLRTYDAFDDLPETGTVRVYAIEEIVVEKLVALSDRARNEPRDLYDLWYLLGSSDLRLDELRAELDAKLAFRQRTAVGLGQAVAGKEDRLRRLWSGRLTHQMSQLPAFDNVFREVQRAIRAAGLPRL